FNGPHFGINGIRELFNIPLRPLIGVTIKSRFGYSLEEVAKQYRESLLGGADFIADDVLLVDPDSDLAYAKRVPLLAKIAREASLATGESKQYFANVSASPSKAIKYAKLAKAEGVGAVTVNAFTMGFAAVEELTNDPDIRLP